MRCPYCGGYHYGYGTPPLVNYTPPDAISVDEAKVSLQGAMKAVKEEAEARKDPYERDVLPKGNGRLWERGEEVTVVFGKDGTGAEGTVMISDGHVPGWRFYGNPGDKGHDHIGPGMREEQLRDKHTGYDGFHDPDE